MLKGFFAAVPVFMVMTSVPAAAQDDYTPVCEGKGSNGMVSMLLCPEGLNEDELAKEGRAICQERKPCGAWVWTDAAFIPLEAPDEHNKLPKESVRNALAIWVNEAEQLVSLTKEGAE